ncbi:MAG: HI0074 family nucleotidyltransferase substrate-binding subunit, partial [Chloroflexota bacterium]
GVKCGATPREAIRAAVKAEWIEDNDLWLKMLASRNLTSHAYDRIIAEEIFDRLPEYRDAFKKLLEQLKKLEEGGTNDSDLSKGEPTK